MSLAKECLGAAMKILLALTACAVAFPLGLVLLTTLGLAQRAVELSIHDWSYNHVWPFFVSFYLLGLMLARRRYQ